MPDYNVVDALLDSLQGNFVSDEISAARRAICDSCDKRNGALCGVCNCIISWATKMPGKKCPIGKWGTQ